MIFPPPFTGEVPRSGEGGAAAFAPSVLALCANPPSPQAGEEKQEII
jgi:hypothetical protein